MNDKDPEINVSHHDHGHRHSHGHIHARHHNLRKLIFPSGRILHVAHSPEEHEEIRRTLSVAEPSEDIDVCLHGSDEHVEAIREIHDHHTSRQSALREQHPGVFDEVEEVVTHLGHLQRELHDVTNQDISLDANFSKYGYAAHLRAKDASPGSESPFPRSLADSGPRGRDSAEQLLFWKRPVLRQYFHKGLLWRSSSSGEVASFELFVDLVYVGVIAVLGDTAAEHPTGSSFLHFAITFLMALKIWTDLTAWVDWFEIDDVVQRISVVFYLVCLFGFTVNIQYGFEETYPAMVAWYLVQRFFVASYYVWIAYLLPMTRGTMLYTSMMTVIAGALWIGSIHVEYPARLGLIWPALLIDHYGPGSIAGFTIRKQAHYKANPNAVEKTGFWHDSFSFYPAINIEHRVERNNQFVTLVLGANILSIIFQLSSHDPPLSAFLGKAILVLLQAFAINWIYFDIDGANLHMHAIRRHAMTMFVWTNAHVSFIMGLILSSGAMAILVIAHDCSNADEHDLGESYAERSEGEISMGLRWFYAAGLGTAILSLAAISWSHEHRTLKGARVGKHVRLAIRCAIGVILICLPLAEELTSLGLIATTCCLIMLILIIDIFGAHCKGSDSFWFGGFKEKQKTRCKYRCAMSKKRGESTAATEEGGKNGETRVTTESVAIHV